MPVGVWPEDPVQKEIGSLTQLVMDVDVEGYFLFMAGTLGWSNVEIQVYLAHYRREVRSGKFCPYYRNKVVWGRKPE